jgi:hypothetical protein
MIDKSAIFAPQSTKTLFGVVRNSLNELHTFVVHKFVEKYRKNPCFSTWFSTKIFPVQYSFPQAVMFRGKYPNHRFKK